MGNVVRKLREARGWTQSDLADRIGVTWQTISRIENARTRIMPKHEKSLAAAFDVSDRELYEVEEPQRLSPNDEWIEDQQQLAEKVQCWSPGKYKPEMPGAIPEIDVEIGAGEGRMGEVINFPIGQETYSAHRVTDEWLIPESYLGKIIEGSSGQTVIMPVVGDSMSPTYQPGDRIIIDMSQNQLRADTVYAISDGFGPPQVKRLERILGSRPPEVYVISDNASHTRQRIALADLTIIGRIVGVFAKK